MEISVNNLVACAANGDLENVKELLDAGVAINGKNDTGDTALGKAAWCGQVEVDKISSVQGQSDYR